MQEGVWGHRPVLQGGREGAWVEGFRPFLFSTKKSHIVAYSPPKQYQSFAVQ